MQVCVLSSESTAQYVYVDLRAKLPNGQYEMQISGCATSVIHKTRPTVAYCQQGRTGAIVLSVCLHQQMYHRSAGYATCSNSVCLSHCLLSSPPFSERKRYCDT